MLRSALVLAVGCLAVGVSTSARTEAAEKMPAYISAAIADPSRPAEDKDRDANRKPGETLEFAGIKPGTKVAELIPGKGYFTRLLSKAVGPNGHVYALSPPRRANAPADAPDPVAATAAIAKEPGYSNLTATAGNPTAISLPEPVDVVFTAQNYHDLHNVQTLDIAAFNKSVFDALKPGGVFIVLDHAAAAGSGTRDTSTLHRIDPETVKSEVTAAGFKFDGESKVLANSADDHSAKVFDPAIRGKTDQFIFKFRKPKK